jgi:hypothetical protein
VGILGNGRKPGAGGQGWPWLPGRRRAPTARLSNKDHVVPSVPGFQGCVSHGGRAGGGGRLGAGAGTRRARPRPLDLGLDPTGYLIPCTFMCPKLVSSGTFPSLGLLQRPSELTPSNDRCALPRAHSHTHYCSLAAQGPRALTPAPEPPAPPPRPPPQPPAGQVRPHWHRLHHPRPQAASALVAACPAGAGGR